MSLYAGSDINIDAVTFDDKNSCATCAVTYNVSKDSFVVDVAITAKDTAATIQAKAGLCGYFHYNAFGWTDALGYQLGRSTLLPFTTDKGKYIIKCDMCDTTGLIRWTIQTREDISQSEFNTLVAQAYAGATATKPEATMKAAVTALRALL